MKLNVKKSNSEKRYQREQKKAIERMLRDAKNDSKKLTDEK